MKSKSKYLLRFSLHLAFLLIFLCLSGCSGSSNSDIIAVTNPAFELKEGFILEIDRQKKAPDGYIEISSASEFKKIRNNPSALYILMDNIDISDYNWKPIENFSGILDGNGYIVSGITNTLFEEIDRGQVKNLGVQGNLENCSAAIARDLDDGHLDNCYFEGSIYNDSGTAGLVYSCSDSSITNCYNKADVTGAGYTAGIVCTINGDYYVINNCFNEGRIQNIRKIGSYAYSAGILARSERTNGVIRHCYNLGTITCADEEGLPTNIHYGDAIACGIMGYANVPDGYHVSINMCYNGGQIEGGDLAFGIALAWGTSARRTQVTNCYNYGEFTHPNSYGIAGCSTHNGHVESVTISYCYNASTTGNAAISNNSTNLYECYYLDDVSDATANGAMFADVHALSKKEMQKKSSFPFDFEQIWAMGKGNYSYPVFGYKNMDILDAVG